MPPQTRLFVGNLPESTDEKNLRNAFVSYGDITNLELKSKPNAEEKSNKFAFVTLSADDYSIESCLKHFSSHDFEGSRLYVTRARESFLERLQRERQQAQQKENAKNEEPVIPKTQPVLKLSEKLNPRKRTFDNFETHKSDHNDTHQNAIRKPDKTFKNIGSFPSQSEQKVQVIEKPVLSELDKKKQDADKKRLESLKQKRQEFRQKQMIIKTGLVGIDKVQNKKVVFSDSDDDAPKSSKSNNLNSYSRNQVQKGNNTLFDDDDSGDDVNFEIKEQYEGTKGQKVLELQSRYKSDKRFVLDERFVEDEEGESETEGVQIGQSDEKHKQLNILQDVLGISIKSAAAPDMQDRKRKSKPGMLRFDPSQPEHSKFLAPVEEKAEPVKKKKKKGKEKPEDEVAEVPRPEVPAVEVSKEQFYKVSDTLKEAIAQPQSFSLRSLFSKSDDNTEKDQEQEQSYIPLTSQPEPRMKNPLDPGERNPFRYDSSDSEDEEENPKKDVKEAAEQEVKAVWKENLFFGYQDRRLIEGLSFFNVKPERGVQKDRKEMKFVMKKRLQNKDRKEHENMFKKKIGGRRKTQKKSFRKRN